MKKSKPNNPEEAEVMCIANALTTLVNMEGVASRLVVVNTDCKFAIPKMENPDISLPYCYLLVNALIKRITHEWDCKLEFRHVKAHSGVNDSRNNISGN